MTEYSAHVEVHRRDLTPETASRMLDELADFHAAVGTSPRGWVDAQLTVTAETLKQATAVAIAVVEAAAGAQAITSTIMTGDEFDARQGWAPMPELVGATDAAALLGVSRQRVLQLVDEHKLTATKIGKSLVLNRDEVDAYRERQQ